MMQIEIKNYKSVVFVRHYALQLLIPASHLQRVFPFSNSYPFGVNL